MPALQALAGIPSFGAQLGQSLGTGFSQGIGSRLAQMLEQKSMQQKNDSILAALGILPSQFQNEEGQDEQSGLKNLTSENVLGASLINPALGSTLSKLHATQEKAQKEKQSKKIAQESFDRMSELLKEGNLGFGSKLKSKAFGGKTAEDVGEFEALSGALEAQLVDKVSRGTLSNARFKYITETLLPKPNDRAATIKGKLKALQKELDLTKPFETKNKILTTELAQEFLDLAKGDKEKARRIAKMKGYEF